MSGNDPHAKFMWEVHGILPDEAPVTPDEYYGKREQELDKSPLPWAFDTGWKFGEFLWGKTMSDQTVNRVEKGLEVGIGLLSNWADAQLPIDGALLVRAGYRGVIGQVAKSAASKDLLAWGKTWDARKALFIQNANRAAATTIKDSNRLGKIGIELADPLYGGGLPTEVPVGDGRRMDFGVPFPGLDASGR